jgi:hypothetical protein
LDKIEKLEEIREIDYNIHVRFADGKIAFTKKGIVICDDAILKNELEGNVPPEILYKGLKASTVYLKSIA